VNRRGIILAGGSGTRLYPVTKSISKQLLPVFDKPLVYYPLTTLMLSGIRDFLVIVNPKDLSSFQALLGNGNQWGISIQYQTQEQPSGIAQALIIAEDYLEGQPSALILGDNLFHGQGLGRNLSGISDSGATVLAYQVTEPKAFGVIEFDEKGLAVSIEEKPKEPKSDWAVPGLYFYDSSAPARAKALEPSSRGELEITDLNLSYMADGLLSVVKLSRGVTWFDTGTAESLLDAAEYVRVIQRAQGLLVGSPEEVAWRMGILEPEQVSKIAQGYKSEYGRLLKLATRK
jgi:glucose-1-phosphate thymidylyltransferase